MSIAAEKQPHGFVTYIREAWNRLVKIVSSTGPTKAEYEYNGLNWRIIKRADTPGSGAGLDQQRMMYYSSNWQLLEERIDDESTFPTGPDDADIDRHVQYVCGQRYIDDLLLHREDSDASGTYDDTWYHLTDVQYSTVALLDTSAGLVERVSYDAYGNARRHRRADLDGDGASGVRQALNLTTGGIWKALWLGKGQPMGVRAHPANRVRSFRGMAARITAHIMGQL